MNVVGRRGDRPFPADRLAPRACHDDRR
jgi:hypothetical protein